MHELDLNYPTTKGKVYTEEEDRYLLLRLHHYGLQTDDVYDKIKRDIMESPLFRFDWFFKSRSPQELQRRCNTLLGMIEKEAETTMPHLVTSSSKGKVRIFLVVSINSYEPLSFRSALTRKCPCPSPRSRRQPRLKWRRDPRRKRRRRASTACFHCVFFWYY